MAAESLSAFEQMLSSLVYTPTTIHGSDGIAGGTGKKRYQKQTKDHEATPKVEEKRSPAPPRKTKHQRKTKDHEATSNVEEKRSPAPPPTPPPPPRRSAGRPSLPQPDNGAHATTAAQSAATTSREAMAADSTLAGTSATVEDERLRQQRQRQELVVPPGGPGTPLVLPPDKGKHKDRGPFSCYLRNDVDGKPATFSRFFVRHHALASAGGEKAGEARREGEKIEHMREVAGEEGEEDNTSPDGVNRWNQIDAANERKKRRKRSCGDGKRKPKKKEKKVVVVSPYFTAAFSDQRVLDGGAGVDGEVEVVVQRRTEKKKEKKVVVVSPYFTAASSDQRVLDGGAGIDGEVEVVVQRKTEKKKEKKVVVVSPYFTSASSIQRVLDGGAGIDGEVEVVVQRRTVKKEKKVVVVSPYFTAASSIQRVLDGGAGVGGEVEVVVQRRTEKKNKRTGPAAESAAEPQILSGRPEAGDGKKKSKRKPQSVQLSAAERFADAYKRVPDDNPWVPPFSDHELLQELHFFDHWRVLVICMLLNRTTGREVQKVLPRLFLLCPDAETTMKVPEENIEEIIRQLGLQKKRSKMIKRMSEEYLRPEWTHVTQLHGIGKYAADAYAIFCSGMWNEVKPNDHKLVDYWRFLLNDKYARESIMVEKSA